MKFLKKLFRKRENSDQKDLEWNVTPVNHQVGTSSTPSEQPTPLPSTGESGSSDDLMNEALPSAESTSSEEAGPRLNAPPTPSLIKPSGEMFLEPQQSIAEMELNAVLEEINTEIDVEEESEIFNDAQQQWGKFGAPAQGRRLISLFRDKDDFNHRQHLEKQRSVISNLVEDDSDDDADADDPQVDDTSSVVNDGVGSVDAVDPDLVAQTSQDDDSDDSAQTSQDDDSDNSDDSAQASQDDDSDNSDDSAQASQEDDSDND